MKPKRNRPGDVIALHPQSLALCISSRLLPALVSHIEI